MSRCRGGGVSHARERRDGSDPRISSPTWIITFIPKPRAWSPCEKASLRGAIPHFTARPCASSTPPPRTFGGSSPDSAPEIKFSGRRGGNRAPPLTHGLCPRGERGLGGDDECALHLFPTNHVFTGREHEPPRAYERSAPRARAVVHRPREGLAPPPRGPPPARPRPPGGRRLNPRPGAAPEVLQRAPVGV